MPDVCGHKCADVFMNWQQNEFIPRSLRGGVITLAINDMDKWDSVDNARPITLLNAALKILAKVLAKWLTLVVCDVIGKAQTRAIPGQTIQDNLHLILYIIE